MKSIQLIALWLAVGLTTLSTSAQTNRAHSEVDKWESSAFTYGEFKVGFGSTQFSSGLRERFEKGNFSSSGGGIATVAAYRKFEKLNHLHFGLKFKGLGASPSSGDNDEEMFFNFWGTAFSTKYFPFNQAAVKGIYVQADYNFVTQFTQKYRNTTTLEFDHQFAIGNSFTIGLGFQYPLKKGYGVVASIEYDWATRQGEVQGVGDQQFQNSNLAFQIGLLF